MFAQERTQPQDGEVRGDDGTNLPDDAHQEPDVDPSIGQSRRHFFRLQDVCDFPECKQFLQQEPSLHSEIMTGSQILQRISHDELNDLQGWESSDVHLGVQV